VNQASHPNPPQKGHPERQGIKNAPTSCGAATPRTVHDQCQRGQVPGKFKNIVTQGGNPLPSKGWHICRSKVTSREADAATLTHCDQKSVHLACIGSADKSGTRSMVNGTQKPQVKGNDLGFP